MRRISEALKDILEGHHILTFGFHHSLFNLSKLSAFLRPHIAARLKRDVSESAILMSLSRMQRVGKSKRSSAFRSSPLEIRHLNIHSDLCVLTFSKNRATHKALNVLHGKIQSADGYMTITEGMAESTIIIGKKFLPLVDQICEERPKYKNLNVAAVGVIFDEKYLKIPGFIHRIVQLMSIQNINLVELASTSTELILYIASDDIKLAFDTLIEHSRF